MTMSTDVATTESTTNEAVLKTKRGGKKAKTAKAATKAAKKRDRGTAKRKSESQREAGGTKKEIVLELLRRKEGATIAEIANATQWQNHRIRGFISGSVSKTIAALEQWRSVVKRHEELQFRGFLQNSFSQLFVNA